MPGHPSLGFSVDDEDLNLEIPFKALNDEFCCPICFNLITNCHMTKCGHNFCFKCIKECLNVKHSCPSCMKDCQVSELIKNLHFDRVVSILIEEKEIASKKYFEKLISEGENNNKNQNENPNKILKKDLSPIEEIFHKHLKKSLGVYEEHYQQLCKKYEETKKTLQNGDQSESNQRKLKTLEKDFETNIQYLLKSYEDYMNNIKPSPKFLPIPVELVIPSKNWTHRYLLKPTETPNDLKLVIENSFQKLNDNILEWSEDNYWIAENPITSEKIVIKELGIPFRHCTEQISKLILNGKLKCKSDVPSVCFSKIFEKGTGLSTNYYQCTECRLNWICQACSKSCHAGHTLQEFMLNHSPTYACCYCKKKKCNIFK